MAKNSQISYTPPTIDPTIAGYAANDPQFALGLMLGRYLSNNYEERGIKKLIGNVTDSNGNIIDPQVKANQQATQQSVQAANQTAATSTTPQQTLAGTQTPQIFAANENPTVESVNPFKLGTSPLTGQPEQSVIKTQIMQQAINDANPQPQQATPTTTTAPTIDPTDTNYRDNIMNRVRDILYNDTSNKWVQSANRGDQNMALYNAGAIGNGVNDNTANPYAIGNYDDPAKNYALMRQNNALTNQFVGTPTMDANGNVTMAQQNYNQSPLAAYLPKYTVGQTAQPTITYRDPTQMTLAQMQNLWGIMETPQTKPILDAVQAAKNPTQAEQNNGVTAQSQQNTPQDNQQQAPQTAQPVQASQPAQAQTNMSAPSSPAQALAQNIVKNRLAQQVVQPTAQTGIMPFNAKDWAAKVWQEGIKEGRPTSQIQAVIDRLAPQAEAAEQNYKDAMTSYYTSKIFNPASPLIPTANNYAQVMPQLYGAISGLYQVNPEAADKVRSMLPGPLNQWAKDVADQTLAQNQAFATNAANQKEKFTKENMILGNNLQNESYKKRAQINLELEQRKLAEKYDQLVPIYGPEVAAKLAYAGGYGLPGMKGSATGANGKPQNQTVNGHLLSNAQQTRANELDANLTELKNNLIGYMQNASKDDNKSFGNAIKQMQDYYGGLSDKDRAVIPQNVKDEIEDLMYAANARREYVAGNIAQSNKYAQSLPPDVRQKFGLIYK